MRLNAESPKKPGIIRRIIQNTEKKVHAVLEKGAEKKVARILANPAKHKREIRLEFERAFHEATKTPTQDNERARRDALQLVLYPTTYLALPLPINIIAIPTIPIFHGIPLLLSNTLTIGFYNIPNTLEALTQKRLGKTLAFSAITAVSVFPFPIPGIHNTIFYDLILRTLGKKTTDRILDRAQQTLSSGDTDSQQYKAFAEAFQKFVRKKSKSKQTIQERLENSLQEADIQKILAQKEKEAVRASQGKRGKIAETLNVYRSFKRKRLEDIVDDKITAIRQLQHLLQIQKV